MVHRATVAGRAGRRDIRRMNGVKNRERMGSMRAGVALVLLGGLLAGCTTTPPRHPDNICDIFQEKRGWYHAAMRQEAKWHIPVSVPMSIMNQESSFRANARTRRTYILWIIPWGHISTAYGYAQAKNEIWHDYQRQTGAGGSRTDYADALNFMNWYITNTRKVDGIPVTDATRQYLAYHEGWTGYRRRTYVSKGWLVTVARKVGHRAQEYQQQYDACRDRLKGGWWENFWDWLF